jgi:hypothetical protein
MYRAVFRDQGVPRVENFVSLGAALGLFWDKAKGRELRPVALWQPESNTLLVRRSYLATQEAWKARCSKRARHWVLILVICLVRSQPLTTARADNRKMLYA